MQKYDNYIIVEAGDTLPNIARSLITTTSEDDDATIESKVQAKINELVSINHIPSYTKTSGTEPKTVYLLAIGSSIYLTGEHYKPEISSNQVSIVENGFGIDAEDASSSDNLIYKSIFVTWEWAETNENYKNTKEYQVNWFYITKTFLDELIGSVTDGIISEPIKNLVTSFTAKGYRVLKETHISDDLTRKRDIIKLSEHLSDSDIKNLAKILVVVTPISKETKENNTAMYFEAKSVQKELSLNKEDIEKFPKPEIEINEYTLKATVSDIGLTNANRINLIVIEDDKDDMSKPFFKTEQSLKGSSNFSITIPDKLNPSHSYKVRCRGANDVKYGPWSDYSDSLKAAPKVPENIKAEPVSKNEVRISWDVQNNKLKYTVEYVKYNKNLTPVETFEAINSDKKSFDIQGYKDEIDPSTGRLYRVISNLEPGFKYYVRIKAANDTNSSSESTITSPWSEPEDFYIGEISTSPTTWSSTTNAAIGDDIDLYLAWVHNSKDNSKLVSSKLYLIINDELHKYDEIPNNPYSDNLISLKEYKDDDTARICYINKNNLLLRDGAKIQWKVQTAGAGTPDTYGDESILREINIYQKPVFTIFDIKKSDESIIDSEIDSFPFYVDLKIGNQISQRVISYYLSIIAEDSYTTIDLIGNSKTISKGSSVYSKNFDLNNIKTLKKEYSYYIDEHGYKVNDSEIKKSEDITYPYYDEDTGILHIKITPNNVTLKNNINYTIYCMATMNSGLTCEESKIVYTNFKGTRYLPSADIGINQNDLTAYIRPYSNGKTDVLLSVYRINYDGTFTEIAKDILNVGYAYVVDPHPSLDYARYRIVAKSITTGEITYNDTTPYYVGIKSIVIQWDEEWKNFYGGNGSGEFLNQPWNGSILKLPYNIEISSTFDPDVSLVEYIGRKHPVSYYGTQLGEQATWNVVIPRTDKETLYAIRRLAIWMGDVYVREPSGVGYWAQISVQYSRNYNDLTIPISFTINRVEGGK